MDVPTARLGMRTDGGRIGSSTRSWRLCLRCASHSSWDIWVLLLHLSAQFAVSPGIAWGQSQPPMGPSKKPFPRSGRKVSLLLLDRQSCRLRFVEDLAVAIAEMTSCFSGNLRNARCNLKR